MQKEVSTAAVLRFSFCISESGASSTDRSGNGGWRAMFYRIGGAEDSIKVVSPYRRNISNLIFSNIYRNLIIPDYA